MSVVYSVDELERLLGTSLGTEDVATARELEKDAVEMVEEKTNRHLGTSQSLTEIRSGDGTQVLELYNNTSTITSVEYRYGSTWTTIDSTEYAVYDDNKLTLFGRNFPHGRYNVRVIYTAGYAPEQIPRDLRKTVGQIVTARWRAERSGEELVIPDEVQEAIDRWAVEDFVPQPRLVLGA